MRSKSLYARCIKQLLDRALALILGILSLPLIVGVGLFKVCCGEFSIIFKQPRVGYGEKIFQIYKFRTMKQAPAEDGSIQYTYGGYWLRLSSLDELPQLWNVLNGDMSLIGPRPLLVDYLDRYTTPQRARHEVRPGITGLAQVKGRNGIDWKRRLDYDLEYVHNITPFMDLYILIETARSVIQRQGVLPGFNNYFQGEH